MMCTEFFLPAGTADADGRLHHGWFTTILPLIDSAPLYNRFDFGYPWDDPRNVQSFKNEYHCALNPGIQQKRSPEGYGLNHYSANSHLFNVNSSFTLDQITDGTANTLLIGEINDGSLPWGHPRNWRDPALGIRHDEKTFGRPIGNAAQFLMGDGSVRFIGEEIDSEIVQGLSTPAGGESVSLPEQPKGR